MAKLPPLPVWQFLNDTGTASLAGCKLYTYAAGTSTPKATYTDQAGTTENANPVIADSAGRMTVWLGNGSYKLLLKDSAGNTISGWPIDNVSGTDQAVSVATMAALRAMTTGSSTLVYLSGYYDDNDGGQGWFYWDSTSSATDNYGTIIRPNALPATGRWIRYSTGYMDVRWFGAKGDGLTDDTVAFQEADAAAVTDGAYVLVSFGEFFIDQNLTITSQVKYEYDGKTTISNTNTLTFSKPLMGEPYWQIFDGAGTTTFAAGTAPSVITTWWGDVGDGTTDDRDAIQAAFDAVDDAGGGTVTLPETGNPHMLGTSGGATVDPILMGSNTKFICKGWIKAAVFINGGGMFGTNGEKVNCYVQDLKLDGNGKYSGGSGLNGAGFGGGPHIVVGGYIKNCYAGYNNNTESPYTGDGGKGIQNETSLGNLHVSGVTFENCFMGISTRRDRTSPNQDVVYEPQIFDSITVIGSKIGFFVEHYLPAGYPNPDDISGNQIQVIFSNFAMKNTGGFEGAIQLSNASNVLFSNGIITTDSSFTMPAFIRGRHRYCRFDNIQLGGTCTSILNNTPGTFCPLSAASTNNYYNLEHIGTIANIMGSTYPPSDATLQNSTFICRINTDVSSSLIDAVILSTTTHCQLHYGAKTIYATSKYISDNIAKFSNFAFAGDVLSNNEQGDWDPVLKPSAGAITSYTASGTYTKIGRVVIVTIDVTITDNGTGSGYLIIETDSGTTPIPTHLRHSVSAVGSGIETVSANTPCVISGINATDYGIWFYDQSYPGGTNNVIHAQVTYIV